MTNFLIVLLIALGSSMWIYAKISRRTGGNTKNSLTVAVIAFIAVVVVLLTLSSFIS